MLSIVRTLLGFDDTWIVLGAALIALIIWILKLVTTPPIIKSVSISADRTSVNSGSNITFNGLAIKSGSPSPNENLTVIIIPPSGAPISSPAISTGTDGQYTYQYTAPVLTGSYSAKAKLTSGEESSVVSFTKITVIRNYLAGRSMVRKGVRNRNEERTLIRSIGCSPRA